MSENLTLFEEEPSDKPARKAKKRKVPDAEGSLFAELDQPETTTEEVDEEPREIVRHTPKFALELVRPDNMPPFLDRVWGQDRPKKILQRLISENHLPHALLLYGPDGIGKQNLALELARHLNCEWGPMNACGICASCLQFESLQVSSLFLAFPTKANDGEIDKKEQLENGDTRITRRYSQKTEEEIATAITETTKDVWTPLQVPGATNVRVISIRFLRQWAQYGTWLGKGRKVAIIAQAHRMNEETSNALLKVLEEPPPDTLLILLTKSPEDLLPTIQSRCQSIRMEPLSVELITEKLMTLPVAELSRTERLSHDEAEEIAILSEGNFVRAREMANSDALVKTDMAIEFLVGCVSSKQRRDLLQRVETMARGRNIDELEKFLIRVVLFLRDALRLRLHTGEGYPAGLLVRGDALLDRLRKFVQFTKQSDLAAAIEEVLRTHDILKRRNPQTMLLLHAMSYRLNRILST